MNKKLLFSLIFSLVIVVFGSLRAEACSCMQRSACQAYGTAQAVFTGKIVKAVDENGMRKHQVQIEEVFFGMDNTPLVDVFTDNSSSCMYAMTEGVDYLIYAWRNEKDGTLSTGMCSRTAPIESAQEDLEYARSVKTSGAQGGTIKGTVSDAGRYHPAPKKPVQIDRVSIESSDGRKYEANIEPDGRYQLSNLSAGEYRIFIELPKGMITDAEANGYGDIEVLKYTKVAGKGCTVKNFDVIVNGGISGKILDAAGSPVSNRRVNLRRLADPDKVETVPEVSAPSEDTSEESDEEMPTTATVRIDKPEPKEFEADYDAYTDENGFYSFKGLPPGRYLLGVGIDDYLDVNSEQDQYLPIYFPSSRKRETALVIELKNAEVLNDKNIQLFPKLKKRTITGQIIRKDGKPEPQAKADYYGKREGYSRADWGGSLKIDAKGNFTFDGYEETEYLITAWSGRPTGADSMEITHSAKCLIVPKKGIQKPFKLILELGGANCDETNFRNK